MEVGKGTDREIDVALSGEEVGAITPDAQPEPNIVEPARRSRAVFPNMNFLGVILPASILNIRSVLYHYRVN